MTAYEPSAQLLSTQLGVKGYARAAFYTAVAAGSLYVMPRTGLFNHIAPPQGLTEQMIQHGMAAGAGTILTWAGDVFGGWIKFAHDLRA